MAKTKDKVIRRVGSQDEAPSSFGTHPTNIPDKYGLTTDQRRGLEAKRSTGVETPIDTSQPSPERVTKEATAGLPGSPQVPSPQGLVPYEQAVKGLQTSGQPQADIASATNMLKQKYYSGKAQADASGVVAGKTLGEASGMIGQTITAEPEAPPPLKGVLGDYYKGVQDLTTKYAEYFDPENQKTSLMDSYNKLYQQSGLEQLDEEIIDAKSIIEGTEDDIRNEIEMAGGFGSDSQVQALALSRNKVLLKNYNNLVAMREMKQNNLDTMLDIADKDRTYADNQIDRMFNYETQMNSLREKFIQNARDQYNKYTPQQLQALFAGNPRQLAFAEQIMGLPPNGLKLLAETPGVETQVVKLDDGSTILIDSQTGKTIKNFGGMKPPESSVQLGDNPQLYSGLKPATATAVRSVVSKYGSEPTIQNFATVQDGYNFASSIDTKTKNPADDQALIYSLAKTLDPGSVVREGEYATAQKYSQSWVNAYGKGVTQAIAGTGFLSETARSNIKKTIEQKYNSTKVSYDNQYKEFSNQINNLTGRNDGDKFLRNYVTSSPPTTDASGQSLFTIPLPGGGTLDLSKFEN